MDELLFIINPVAGGGKARAIEDIIIKEMEDYQGKISIMLTENPKEATTMAYQSHIETIIAVGGDGTITEVAKGMIRRGYGTLGIIPGGTGNDFTKSLGIEKNTIEAIKTIKLAKTMKIDIGLANGYKFLNIGSVGLDAEVTRESEKIKKYVGGKASYILSIFVALAKFKQKKVAIEIDGRKEEKNLVLFAIGNGKYYGGGLQMIPNAILNDGFLHACIVKDVSRFRILTIFPEVYKGKHLRHTKYTETFKAKRVKIYSKQDIYMNLDGELFSPGREVEFSISDEKLNVIIP
nr:diacylglycerol kinase family protein [Tissierella sp.]